MAASEIDHLRVKIAAYKDELSAIDARFDEIEDHELSGWYARVKQIGACLGAIEDRLSIVRVCDA